LQRKTAYHQQENGMNVAIVRRGSRDVVARYEIHRAGNGSPPADDEYYDEAWQRAVEDGVVELHRRRDYEFQLQRPKTLYESSR
jgi:hypothetical protein